MPSVGPTPSIAWPEWLRPLQSGYSTRLVANRARTDFSIGPSYQRPKTRALWREEKWKVLMKGRNRLDDLVMFYEVTSKGGSLWASSAQDPVTGERVYARLTRVGTFRYLAPDTWECTCDVEISEAYDAADTFSSTYQYQSTVTWLDMPNFLNHILWNGTTSFATVEWYVIGGVATNFRDATSLTINKPLDHKLFSQVNLTGTHYLAVKDTRSNDWFAWQMRTNRTTGRYTATIDIDFNGRRIMKADATSTSFSNTQWYVGFISANTFVTGSIVEPIERLRGFVENIDVNKIRNQSNVSIPRERVRSTLTTRQERWPLLLTTSQLEVLFDYYVRITRQGSVPTVRMSVIGTPIPRWYEFGYSRLDDSGSEIGVVPTDAERTRGFVAYDAKLTVNNRYKLAVRRPIDHDVPNLATDPSHIGAGWTLQSVLGALDYILLGTDVMNGSVLIALHESGLLAGGILAVVHPAFEVHWKIEGTMLYADDFLRVNLNEAAASGGGKAILNLTNSIDNVIYSYPSLTSGNELRSRRWGRNASIRFRLLPNHIGDTRIANIGNSSKVAPDLWSTSLSIETLM